MNCLNYISLGLEMVAKKDKKINHILVIYFLTFATSTSWNESTKNVFNSVINDLNINGTADIKY